MKKKHPILFTVILALFTCIAVLLFRFSDLDVCPNCPKCVFPERANRPPPSLSGQDSIEGTKHEVDSINSNSQVRFLTNGIPIDPQSADNPTNEHSISSEKAVSICREDLQKTFPNTSFSLDSICIEGQKIIVVLSDRESPSGANSYNRYHFTLNRQTGSIVDDSIEVVEDMVIVDTPSSK